MKLHDEEPPAPCEFNHRDCLNAYPFGGDFGEPGDRVFSDKIVIARKGGKCHLCREDIIPGHPIRRLVGIFDGQLYAYRWCHCCCRAFAVSWHDRGDAWLERAKKGMDNAKLTIELEEA